MKSGSEAVDFRSEALRYLSSRGGAPAVDFETALLSGLAPDGGLYLPERFPVHDAQALAGLAGLDYPALAAALIAPYTEGAFGRAELEEIAAEAYASFDHQAVAPLVQTGTNEWALELFHGPTLAFKDLALQLLGRLFDRALARRGARANVLAATSGDTGSAAIEALRDKANVALFVLHPKGRISEVQRRQMTTVAAPNVHNVAIEGTFDDCQALVKALFNDAEFRAELDLAAVNSINWARIMAQTVYYFAAALALGGGARAAAFAVPTGNFGDVFAGHVAKLMGLPVARLLVATNRNDILARFFSSGEYRKSAVEPSLSPSMDIQVASNFERLLYLLHGCDGAAVAALMAEFRQSGTARVTGVPLEEARALYAARRVSDDETLATIATLHRETGLLFDPHSATGFAALRTAGGFGAMPAVVLCTAHPAKFPDTVEKATGVRPALPARLERVMTARERCATLPNDAEALKAHLRAAARGRKARVA